MRPWYVLLICLSCSLLRASADYFLSYHDKFHPYLLLAGVLLILLLSLGKRRSVPASTTRPTITTAIPQLQCSDGYSLYPGPGRSFCFRFSNIFRSWESAATVCRMENAELLVLDNTSLSRFGDVMREQFPPAGVTWLRARTGVNRIASYTGGPAIPSNSPLWVTGEPDTPGNCIALGYDQNGARLLDEPCGNFLSHVCQKI